VITRGGGFTGSIANFSEGLNEHGRSQRGDNNTNQADKRSNIN